MVSSAYIEHNINKILSVARVFAILSVIIAHARNTNLGSVSVFTERLGTIGVVLFFFISGFYFNPKRNQGIGVFFFKKITTIVIPWIITGTVVFLLGNRGFFNWINWIVGNGTYLWFLTMLVCSYFVFYYIKDNKNLLFLAIILNLTSLILTSFGYLNTIAGYAGITINNYLNIFNWIGFFALGILSQKRLVHFISFLRRNIVLIFVLFLIALSVSVYMEPLYAGYFSKLAIPVEILGCIAILALSTLKLFDKKINLSISSFVFTIYLTHFLVFPIKRILGNTMIFELINPIVILIVNYLVLVLGMWVSKKIGLDYMYRLCLGIRKK